MVLVSITLIMAIVMRVHGMKDGDKVSECIHLEMVIRCPEIGTLEC